MTTLERAARAAYAALGPFAKMAATQPIAHNVAGPEDQRLTVFFDDGSRRAERAPGKLMTSELAACAKAHAGLAAILSEGDGA